MLTAGEKCDGETDKSEQIKGGFRVSGRSVEVGHFAARTYGLFIIYQQPSRK